MCNATNIIQGQKQANSYTAGPIHVIATIQKKSHNLSVSSTSRTVQCFRLLENKANVLHMSKVLIMRKSFVTSIALPRWGLPQHPWI